MEIDKVIKAAIEGAVTGEGQDPDLAKKIVAWVGALSTGLEDVTVGAAAKRHLEVLYESVNENAQPPRNAP